LVVVPLVIGALSGGATPPPAPSGEAVAPEATVPGVPSMGSVVLVIVLALVLSFVVSCACLYVVMNFMGHLQYDDLTENLLNVAKCQLIMTLLSFIPIIGVIFALVYLAKHFELSCGELLIAVIALAVLNGIIWAILSSVFGAVLAGVLSQYVPQTAV